jgi:hypothetical protein
VRTTSCWPRRRRTCEKATGSRPRGGATDARDHEALPLRRSRRRGDPARPVRGAPPARAVPLHVRPQPGRGLRRLLDVRRPDRAPGPTYAPGTRRSSSSRVRRCANWRRSSSDDDGRVYRTYFTNWRAVEAIGTVRSILDRTPLGRYEDWEDTPEGRPHGQSSCGGDCMTVTTTTPADAPERPGERNAVRACTAGVSAKDAGVFSGSTEFVSEGRHRPLVHATPGRPGWSQRDASPHGPPATGSDGASRLPPDVSSGGAGSAGGRRL